MTGKWILPWTAGPVGFYVSGELGHWWIDDTGFDLAFGIPADPSYTYWNAGIALHLQGAHARLPLSRQRPRALQDCANFLLTGVPNNSNNWCDDTFIVALKFDTTINSIK